MENRKQRRTKKSIYAKHGVVYDTKTQKILAPINGGMWIKPLLVNGNHKIGKNAYHFSTLPTNRDFQVKLDDYTIVTVKGTCPCTCLGKDGKTNCYATKGNYNYPSVIKSLGIKTILCYEALGFVERAIKAQLEADKIKLCRIHASGDFFSIAYIEMWARIAEEFNSVTFWTYTKNRKAENAFDNLENANIVKSFLPNGKFNFGHCDHIIKMYHELKASGKKVHICFCGIEEYANIPVKHCTDCHSCAENDFVLFIEHSTEYKAQDDPLFPDLVKLILSQEV